MEFKALGEQLIFEKVKQVAIYNDEAKRQAAFVGFLSKNSTTPGKNIVEGPGTATPYDVRRLGAASRE